MESKHPNSSVTQSSLDDKELDARSIDLMTLIAEQDEKAFQELIELHQAAVFGTAFKLLGNSHDAEDISQQVFLRVWKSASRYKPKAKFRTWLFTILRNLVFNETRRKKRKLTYSIDEAEEKYHHQIADSDNVSPEARVLENELRIKVDEAIASLPEKQRMALILRRYEELPYEEIAKILGISLGALKSVLFRAREDLKVKLQKYLSSKE